MIAIANFLSADLDDLAVAICSSLRSTVDARAAVSSGATVEDFHAGRVGAALICGLAYSLVHDAAPKDFAPVAAPLIEDERTGSRPVYFSEIVVSGDSDARDLEALSGARLAYNETISFSGYRALEHGLTARGLSWNLFGERTRTGSHRASLDRIAKGESDVAAIDSQVLALARRRNPSLARRIRVLASLGPYPSPPLAVNSRALDAPPERILALLQRLPATVLHEAGIRGWQPVDDAYYDPIREATRGMANPFLVMSE